MNNSKHFFQDKRLLIITVVILGSLLGGICYFVNNFIFLFIAGILGMFLFYKTIKYPELWLAFFSLAYFFKGGCSGSIFNLTTIALILSIISVMVYLLLKIKKNAYKNKIYKIDLVIILFS